MRDRFGWVRRSLEQLFSITTRLNCVREGQRFNNCHCIRDRGLYFAAAQRRHIGPGLRLRVLGKRHVREACNERSLLIDEIDQTHGRLEHRIFIVRRSGPLCINVRILDMGRLQRRLGRGTIGLSNVGLWCGSSHGAG
ncbi:MAG: hypothetical protein HC774_07095 [Sphingomonadales bacterium]|nr:hypothetical protein [Sphingomonadales bacterium]